MNYRTVMWTADPLSLYYRVFHLLKSEKYSVIKLIGCLMFADAVSGLSARNVLTTSKSSPDQQAKPRNTSQMKKNNIIFDSDSEDHELDLEMEATEFSGHSQARKPSIKVKWSDKELDILKVTFKKILKSKHIPGYAQIKDMQKRHSILSRRTPAQIKARFIQLKAMLNKK